MTENEPRVITEGTGKYEQLADRAEVDIGFSATGPDRARAVAALAEQVSAVQPALEHPALQVRHRGLWVSSEWRKNRVVGCRAAERIALVVTDVAALGDILAALVGAEPSDLHGPRWTLADPTAAQREAQRRAVADARERAEGYAGALGGRIGVLCSLSDASAHGHSPRMAMAMGAAESAPDVRDLGLEPELVEVTARCTTTWTINL